MRRLTALVLSSLASLVAQSQPVPAPPAGPRQVTIAAIPGIVDSNAQWKLVWQGTNNADGIVGYKDGLLFAQEQTSQIIRLDGNDIASVFNAEGHGVGSLGIGPENKLIALERTCTDPGQRPDDCQESTGIAELTPARKVLADRVDGKPLGRVNDMVVNKHGGVYFSSGGAFYFDPASGKVTQIGENLRANGIMLSPDEKTLYVTNGPAIAAFDVQPDGLVTNQREFAKLQNGNGDGMAIDSKGRLYVADQTAGVEVFGADGKFLGLIPTPRTSISVAFGGKDKKWLYVSMLGSTDPDGTEHTVPQGARNTAMSIYKIPMLSEGFKGRAK